MKLLFIKSIIVMQIILVLILFTNCINYNINQTEFKKCNYDLLFKNNEFIPNGLPCNGKIFQKHGLIKNSGFYKFHSGIDFINVNGTNIYATASGTVAFVGYLNSNGYFIKISHHYGYETVYSHCKKIFPLIGQQITKGQLIALMGATGVALGNVLQYEIYINGNQINPEPYLTNSYLCQCSLLHYSVINRNYNNVEVLVKNIKNKNITDSFGLTPLKISEIINDQKLIKLLR